MRQNTRTTDFRRLLALGGCALLGLAPAVRAQTYTTLVSFDGSNGNFPTNMSLVQGTDGNFYGTTSQGGANGYGTVFNMTPAGALTVLYSFSGRPKGGANPEAGLVQATNGYFYGTTSGVYADSYGTVFKMSPADTLTTLHEFVETDGAVAGAAMVQATNDDLYGTTAKGGFGYGTIFKVTPKGKFTSLYAFEQAVGENPNTLVQAPNGNFYGTAGGGGANGAGTVFKMTPAGVLTTIHTFNTTDGSNPYAGLLLGADGNFYGTTYGGGAYGKGTIFQITPAGTLTTLHSFDGTDGSEPWSGILVQATDGNFYGTTSAGGAHGDGTIFEFTPGGVLTVLHSFAGPDGGSPQGGLVQGTDGTFYGATTFGGGSLEGALFSLSTGLGPFVKTLPSSGKVGASVEILGTNLSGATGVSFNGTAAAFTVVSPTEISTTVPTGATTGSVQVIAPGGALLSNGAFRVTR
jgi:uncharacterized repeat protein (TIGR03803 family)